MEYVTNMVSQVFQGRPSSAASKPGRLPPVKRHSQNNETSGLRRLQGEAKGRANPYDMPDSPQKPSITLQKPQEPQPEISPLRKDKKRRPNREASSQPASASQRLAERRRTRDELAVPDGTETHDQQPSPRRSPRKHRTGDDIQGTSPSNKQVPSIAVSEPQEPETNAVDENGFHVDHDGPSGVEDNDDPAVVEDEAHTSQIGQKSPNTPGKRRRGRPSKARSSETETSEKRGRGRPRKSKPSSSHSTPAKQATPQESQHLDRTPASQEKPKEEPKVERIRKSQVVFDVDVDHLESDDDAGESVSRTQQPGQRKRKRSSREQQSAPRQLKKAKAQQQSTRPGDANARPVDSAGSDEERNEDEQEDEFVENTNHRRLFGQGGKLDQIYASLKNVGLSHRNGEFHRAHVEREDADIVALHKLCKKATRSFTELQNDPESNESSSDPPEEFDEIKRRVRGLCGHDKDFPTNTKDQDKASQIYYHLIPSLVKLLRHMIESYEAIDGRGSSPATITDSHLKSITEFIALILEMGSGAEEYSRPESDLAVIRPVRVEILAPLKVVKANLLKYLRAKEQAQIMARERAFQDAETARLLHEEEEEQRERDRQERLRQAWRDLHDERRHVEGFCGSRAKIFHLRIPETPVEVDQNGESFERLQVFGRRIGPHPADVERARDHTWSLREIDALQRGLRQFAGPGVYRDIFREKCVPRGELNKYNVTEIVTIAADMKEHYEEVQMERQGFVEDWVRQIPVWTNVHALLGQENAI